MTVPSSKTPRVPWQGLKSGCCVIITKVRHGENAVMDTRSPYHRPKSTQEEIDMDLRERVVLSTVRSTVHIFLEDALQEALGVGLFGVGATKYEVISNVAENDRAICGR